MDWDLLFFQIFPYISIVIFVVGVAYRTWYRPFSVSSLSSQLLERKKLYWGSISFHWGILLILAVHLLAILFPRGLLLWNAVPLRLYLLEFSGLAMGIWALVGLAILLYRRLSDRKVQAVTTWMDIIILALLLLSVVTGVLVATGYRFGSYWFAGIFSPYIVSIFTLAPRLDLVTPLPWTIKLHVLNFFVLLALLPFSRLVHIVTYPLGYLVRPWQIVIWYRRRSTS